MSLGGWFWGFPKARTILNSLSLSCPCGSDVSAQLLSEYHACLTAAVLLAMMVINSNPLELFYK